MAKMSVDEVRPIIIHDEEHGEDYTLEFSKESVKFAEMHGFDVNEVAKFPMTKLPELFFYAFRMHHRNVSREKTDKLLNSLGGLRSAVFERLGQLYLVPFESLVPEEDEPKNRSVTVEM